MPPKPAAAPLTRHRRFSREEIVEAAKELLQEDGRETFSTRKLAARVGLSVMGIYTYFQSKDDILDAVAEDYFSRFKSPRFRGNWRSFIQRWADAVYAFFSAHPEAIDLIAWEDHVSSPAWRRICLPLAKMWSSEGLKGQKLLHVTNWTTTVVLTEIANLRKLPSEKSAIQLYGALGEEFPEDKPLLREIATALMSSDKRRGFRFAVEMLLVSLDTVVPAAAD